MRKLKLRSLRALYDATGEVSELKNEFGKNFPCRTFHVTMEHKTCNLSATPCSSRIRVEGVASEMGKAPSQCPLHEAGSLSPSKSGACNYRLYANSETSNFVSVCSSHDPLSENAESKATLRASDVSEDIEMLQTVTTGKPSADDQSISKRQIFVNQYDKQKDLECHDDNVSCISRADHNCSSDRNNVSCGSSSINSLSVEGSGNAAGGCPAAKSRSCKCNVESLLPACALLNKSEPVEVSSLKDVYVIASSLTGEPSESSMEQVESSLEKLEGISIAKFVKPKVDIDKMEPVTEAMNCSEQNKHQKKSSSFVDGTNVQQPAQQSQLVNRSDILEHEVKICDICGDVGREAFLAICSKCSDGAEHTYCMRVMMENIPGGDWMCEECMLKEKTIKQKLDKFEKVGVSTDSSTEITRGSSHIKTSESENRMKLNTKDLDVEKGKSSLFSAKRPLDGLEVASVAKGRALETTDGTPRTSNPCGKAFLSRDSPSKILIKGEKKTANLIATSCGCSSKSSEASLPTALGNNLPKIQSRLQKAPGFLFKLNSFNAMGSRQKVKLPKEAIQRRTGVVTSMIADRKKEGIAKVMSKSLSFSTQPNHSNYGDSKVKMPSSKFYNGEALKKLRPATGNGLLPSSVMVGSESSALKVEDRLSCHIETELAGSSESNCRDLENVQSHKNVNLANPKPHLERRGTTYLNDIAGSGMERESLSLRDGFGASSSFRFLDNSLEQNLGRNAELLQRDQVSCYASCFASGGTNEQQDRALNETKQPAVVFAESVSARATKCSPATSVEEPRIRGCPTVPEIDYIWQGKFKIQSNQMLPGFVDKIQAHLSTFASPKAHEVATKFPSTVFLEEVPRFSTWPVQFSENAAAEDDIALYFFAEDLESYKRNYRSLLESMIKNDLALKGNFGGIELLIFSSNLLPEKAQRWNNLYFLWGVFRARRTNYSDHASFRKKIFAPSLSGVISDQNTYPQMQSNESLTVSNASISTQIALCSTALQDLPSVSSVRKDVTGELNVSCSKHKLLAWQTNFSQQAASCMATKIEEPIKNLRCTSMPLEGNEAREGRREVNKYSQHAGRENDMDYDHLDKEREPKRLKTSVGKYENDGTPVIHGSSNKLPSLGLGSSFLIGKTSAPMGSSPVSPDQGILDNTLGMKSSQFQALPARSNGSPVVNLELSLGTEETYGNPKILHPFLRIVDEKNNEGKCPDRSKNKDGVGGGDGFLNSLSLSLAPPRPNSF